MLDSLFFFPDNFQQVVVEEDWQQRRRESRAASLPLARKGCRTSAGGSSLPGISTATKSTWNRSIKHKRTSSNSLNGYELRAFRFTWLKSTTYRLRLALLWMYSTPQPESRQEIIRAQGAWNPNHNSHTILHGDLAQCPLPHTIACFSQFASSTSSIQ